jgi:Fic family protein
MYSKVLWNREEVIMTTVAQDALGFTWDRRSVPSLRAYTPERAVWRFRHVLKTYVWDAAVLEGNPFTFPEVETLLDGVTVGGKKLSDERQVLNLAEAARDLADLVLSGEFRLDKVTSDHFQYLIARDEALESGMFRGEGRERASTHVGLGEYGQYTPPPTEHGGANLRAIYDTGTAAILGTLADPFEQGGAYFLFGALQQLYFDGNKRTSRYMMNGWLMSHGIDAISIPARRRLEFNQKMIGFYRYRDGTAMFAFLASCWADAQ